MGGTWHRSRFCSPFYYFGTDVEDWRGRVAVGILNGLSLTFSVFTICAHSVYSQLDCWNFTFILLYFELFLTSAVFFLVFVKYNLFTRNLRKLSTTLTPHRSVLFREVTLPHRPTTVTYKKRWNTFLNQIKVPRPVSTILKSPSHLNVFWSQ